MKHAVFFGIGLLACLLTGCFTRSDTHPEIPHLPAVDNAAIRVDSLPNPVHEFIFSADKTKIYAIVLTASTGVFADHTLVEFDQTGNPLRQLPMGEMSIQKTELALFSPDSLVWKSSEQFYIIDLRPFKLIDRVHGYWTGNYPETQKAKDQAKVDEESRAWFRRKQAIIGKQFGIQKTDSVTLAVLEGNKANGDAYQEALQKAKSEHFTEWEPSRRKAYFEAYALSQIRSAKSTFGYRSTNGEDEYVFIKSANGNTEAFNLDKAVFQKTGIKFRTGDVNSRADIDRKNSCFDFKDGQSMSDKTGSLRLMEVLTMRHRNILENRFADDEFRFYYELRLGSQTARFKWILPFKVSQDFYLQSANGSAFVLKMNTLYWFHFN